MATESMFDEYERLMHEKEKAVACQDFPRAAELESNGENEFTILASDAQPLIRYRIEAAERRAS